MIFTGGLALADMAATVTFSDIFVATYQGNALVEAMALGTPVVAYDNPPHRALAPTEGLVVFVPDRDVPALARALGEAVSDPDLLRDRGEAAQASVLKLYDRANLDATAVRPLVCLVRPNGPPDMNAPARLLYIDLAAQFLNPTRSLLPIALSMSGSLDIFGPGYVASETLAAGLEAFSQVPWSLRSRRHQFACRIRRHGQSTARSRSVPATLTSSIFPARTCVTCLISP